jgi:hypothetical protein
MQGIIDGLAKVSIANHEVTAFVGECRAASLLPTSLAVHKTATKNAFGVVEVGEGVTIGPAHTYSRCANGARPLDGSQQPHATVSDCEPPVAL